MSYSKKECLEGMKKAKEKTDGFLTIKKYDQTGVSPSSKTIRRHFGSWNKAKKELDLAVVDKTKGFDHVPFGTVSETSKSSGYEMWYHTHESEMKMVRAHRLLAVAEFGIKAVEGMEVHHKSGIKWDNRPSNIELKSKSDHTKTHHEEGLFDDNEFWKESPNWGEK